MKYIYVCSPLRGDIETNINNAKQYCSWICDHFKDTIPVAPHIYFTQFLDDEVPQERELGMQMGLEWLNKCDEVWVFGDRISEGMKGEILRAENHGILITYVKAFLVED